MFFLLSLIPTTIAFPENYLWDGMLNGDWDDPVNWGGLDYPKDNDDEVTLIGINDCNLQDGANPSVTIGDLIIQAPFDATFSLNAELIIDDAATWNGALSIENGILNTNNQDITLDSDFSVTINGFVTISPTSTINMPQSGNLSVSGGAIESSGTITSSGYYLFFIDYDAVLWLNDSTVENADLITPFPYSVGAGTTTTVNDLTVTQAAGSDITMNITQEDFSVKDSGTVLTFIANGVTGITSTFTVTNLTPAEMYTVKVDGWQYTNLQADLAGEITFSYSAFSARTFTVSWISGSGSGGNIPVVFAGFQTNITGDRMVCFDPNPSYATKGIISYSWTFGDGNVSHQESPCHRFEFQSVEKTYFVSLTVTDKMYYTNTTVKEVTSSNWNFFIGIGILLTLFIGAMFRATLDKGEIQKRFKTWRSKASRFFR